jgi:hypothetical protein
MPSISSGDLGQGSGPGKTWLVVLGVLLVGGVGYGVYHVVTAPAKAGTSAKKPDRVMETFVRTNADQALEQRRQEERDFRSSLGMTAAQLDELDTIDRTVVGAQARLDKIKAMLTADQFEKFQQHERRGRGGWGGGPGGPGGFGGFGGFGGPGGPGGFNGGGGQRGGGPNADGQSTGPRQRRRDNQPPPGAPPENP